MTRMWKGCVAGILGAGLTFSGVAWAGEDVVPPQKFASLVDTYGKPQGRISGRILFPSEYSQRSVTFSFSGRSFVTLPDGRFVIERIPLGQHVLVVRTLGYDPVEMHVKVNSASPLALKDIRIKMARGQVSGRLVTPDGSSAANISLKLTEHGGATTTSSDGLFTFMGVPAGSHTLLVEDPRFQTPGDIQVEMAPNSRRNLGVIQVSKKMTTTGPAPTAVLVK
ncbi:MAG: carboxypeptidase regulatory-like domain-containing protein [Deltaproteobacteria bacterium]|nr:carboxypeptidase regulatory-like domain-containing protein [Deltaproteobacteria bacterium]